MTNLELLDTAVRMVKRDGPWGVYKLGFKISETSLGNGVPRLNVKSAMRGGVLWEDDDIVVHSDTIAAIRGVYSALQQLTPP